MGGEGHKNTQFLASWSKVLATQAWHLVRSRLVGLSPYLVGQLVLKLVDMENAGIWCQKCE